MVGGSRWAFAALSWLFVAGLAYQVLLIGQYLFAGQSSEAHIGFGYLLPLLPLLALVAGALGRAGGRMLAWVGAVTVLTIVQGILPPLRDSVPTVAALHPLNAVLISWMAVTIAQRALTLARAAQEA